MEVTKQISIYCGDSVSNNLHQLFPQLEAITSKQPTSCKLILEYLEEVKPPTDEIQKELDKSLESHLSKIINDDGSKEESYAISTSVGAGAHEKLRLL